MSRRVYAEILAQAGKREDAWNELTSSLELLREATNRHEVARTLVAIAALAPALDRYEAGQRAITEALPTLRDMGAQRDLDDALVVVQRYHYKETL